ncbi:hypothetical protein [Paraflavitalea speifideaquila]|uniref:tetratricopeptide repeat protein n=1 Tax=Paraflavitalea speifideaquila TaxID=3076558 RepID=UPI0028E97879|nr:hypothetical protein [Paraflavitalea speifideiaquila]
MGKGVKDPAILLAVANAWINEKNGDPNTALQVLDMAAKKDADNPAFNVLRGNAYRKLTNGTEAYRAYQAALNEDGKNAAALYQMGKIFVAQKMPMATWNISTKPLLPIRCMHQPGMNCTTMPILKMPPKHSIISGITCSYPTIMPQMSTSI